MLFLHVFHSCVYSNRTLITTIACVYAESGLTWGFFHSNKSIIFGFRKLSSIPHSQYNARWLIWRGKKRKRKEGCLQSWRCWSFSSCIECEQVENHGKCYRLIDRLNGACNLLHFTLAFCFCSCIHSHTQRDFSNSFIVSYG